MADLLVRKSLVDLNERCRTPQVQTNPRFSDFDSIATRVSRVGQVSTCSFTAVFTSFLPVTSGTYLSE